MLLRTQIAGRRSWVRQMAVALLLGCSLRVAADVPVQEVAIEEEEIDPGATTPDESDDARIYSTPEEQREAGRRTEITPWLTVYGLAEAELYYDDFDVERGRDDDSGREDVLTLQLGLIIDLFELAEAEAVLEYATDTGDVVLEEAFIAFEHEPWGLVLGKLYTPFGVYFSNFARGPIIEFGETRADEAATLSFTPDDASALSLTLYRGRARRQQNSDQWNWVFAAESALSEDWSVGLSYQSDLADADSRLLQDDNDRYAKRVPGISGYVVWADDRYEATLELLGATRSFAELEQDRDQPWAWNAEVTRFFPERNFELALRFEGSRELEDEPKYQYGVAVTWRPGTYVSLTLEYLRGEFKKGLATSDQDEPYTHVDHVGGMLSIEF